MFFKIYKKNILKYAYFYKKWFFICSLSKKTINFENWLFPQILKQLN